MQRVANQNTKPASRSNVLLVSLLVVLLLASGTTAFITFSAVRNFISSWNITDLPGVVVNPGQTPTPGPSNNPVEGAAPPPAHPPSVPEPQEWDGASRVTVLVMGLDYRDWESGEGAPRTDTMILFSVDPLTKTAGMLSIPRDLWVTIPGFEEPDRINTAYRFGEIYQMPGGGPGLAMKTVEGLLGLPIEFYAQIDFFAFEQFIDELGGIKVDVPARIKIDPLGDDNTTYLDPGVQVLPGDLALAYARARNSEGGDFDRAKRQQQVVMGIRNRVLSSNALPLLISRAPALYDSVSAGIHTNMTLEQAIKLAWLIQQIPEENIKRGIIGAEQVGFGKSPDGDEVLKPRPEKIRLLRDEVFTASGPVSPAAVGASPQELMQLENASLSILNGSGVPGLATRSTDFLKTAGGNITATGDAPEQYTYTTLISYTGNPYTIRYLVELMGISPNKIFLRYDPNSQVDIVLYLGYDWANNNPMP